MEKLFEKAVAARERAYAPYSGFKVGVALEVDGGKIYTGCNIENAAHSPAVCAERVAICKAVSEGDTQFKRLLIVADTDKPCPPCGVCRQALSEFCSDLEIILTNLNGGAEKTTLKALLPRPFSKGFF